MIRWFSGRFKRPLDSSPDKQAETCGSRPSETATEAAAPPVINAADLDVFLAKAGYEQPVHVSAARILGCDGWQEATTYFGMLKCAAQLVVVVLLPDRQVHGQNAWVMLPINDKTVSHTYGLIHPTQRTRAHAFVGMAVSAHDLVDKQAADG